MLAGLPLFINGQPAPRAIPDTVAIKQPADPAKAPKVRFCRNASASYILGALTLSFIIGAGLHPSELGFTANAEGNWEAPSLNDTVDPRHTTISFQRLLDLAAMTLLAWAFSLFDWKGAFRQVSLSPDDYRFTYYVVATTKMVIAGRLRNIELIAVDSRLFFGGAAATSTFSTFPIVHCRGRVLAERRLYNDATPHRKANWKWNYSITRSGPSPALPKGNRVQDFGLAQLEDCLLPKPRPKMKSGKRIFPIRPQTSQALKFYRKFRLNHTCDSFGFYVDDGAYAGAGRPDTSRHRGNFDWLLTDGEVDSAIDFKKAEKGIDGKIVHAKPGEPVVFGGIEMHAQPDPRLGLPKDKRLQNASLIQLVLAKHSMGCQIPFKLLETLLGKLGWWAMIDRTIWCYLAPLQWHLAYFLDLFVASPTDPRTLVSTELEPGVIKMLEFCLNELLTTNCTVSSYIIAHLPLFDGCFGYIADAAGSQKEGIGLLLLGEMLRYRKGEACQWRGGGATALGLYPTQFEANLRQNSKEMLGVFLGALKWAHLAQAKKLPLLVLTDNMTVLSTIKKARSGS